MSEREILQEMYDDSLDIDDIMPADGVVYENTDTPSITE